MEQEFYLVGHEKQNPRAAYAKPSAMTRISGERLCRQKNWAKPGRGRLVRELLEFKLQLVFERQSEA
jgi:hypothetical protein